MSDDDLEQLACIAIIIGMVILNEADSSVQVFIHVHMFILCTLYNILLTESLGLSQWKCVDLAMLSQVTGRCHRTV